MHKSMQLFVVILLIVVFQSLWAEYVPQNLLFETVNEIVVTEQDSDYVVTNCDWFNKLTETYQINYLQSMYSYCENQLDDICSDIHHSL